jgi:TatD DNase family protein
MTEDVTAPVKNAAEGIVLIDSHAHLQFSQFDSDWQAVVERAAQAGVSGIVVVGTDLASSRRALELAERNGLYATVGFHPHAAEKFTQKGLDELEQLAAAASVVAIGEIGLDYFRDLAPRNRQRQAFEQQLHLAAKLRLPVVIHDRDAHDDVAGMLEEHAEDLPGAVLHCYSAGIERAQVYVDQGFFLSVSGQITYRRSEALRATFTTVPIDNILLETDAPYLTPQPVRGKRNEPCFLTHTARQLAELKGMRYDEVCRITSSNAARVFSIEL